jgi:hypothetical protein
MGTDTKLIRKRLLDGGVDGLVELVLNDLARRPIRELVDAEATAGLIGDSLRAAAADEDLEARLRDRIARAVDAGEDLGAEIPVEILDPVRDVLRSPWTADPALMRTLLDHRAVRNLTRDVLTDSLLRFGRSLRAMVSGAGGGGRRGRLRKLAGVATGVASVAAGAIASEVERQLEGRVRDVIDDAIARAMDRSVSYMSGRDAAADLGAFRAHAFDTLRRRTPAEVRADVDRLDREGLLEAVAEAIRAVAAWEGLDRHLAHRVRSGLDFLGDQSLGELLEAESPRWRERLAGPLAERARAVVKGKGFTSWLRDLLEG